MLDALVKLAQVLGAFVLVLGPLIVVHEFGHFGAAKWLRIGVPVFSVGLGPRLFGLRRRETDYRVSAIPLGGYVRLLGDEADEHRTGSPAEFLSRPRWQRFLVYLAGPAVNIAVALLIVWLLLIVFGMDRVAEPGSYPVVVRVDAGSPAEASGVRAGDRVIRVADSDARENSTFLEEVLLFPETVKPLVIERDGERIVLQLQTGLDPKYHLGDPGWLVLPDTGEPPRVAQVFDGAAKRAGLLEGDVILGANGREPISEPQLRVLLQESAGREVVLKVERAGERLELALVPELQDGRGMIGVDIDSSKIEHREFGLLAAAAESLRINLRQSQTLFLTLQRLVRGNISMRAFSGPIEIAQVSRQMVTGGIETVLWFMAFISLQLGILNLLPIPVLDGGHILILGIEGVMRRELSERLKERVMQVGIVFLIAFFGVIIYFDVLKSTLSS